MFHSTATLGVGQAVNQELFQLPEVYDVALGVSRRSDTDKSPLPLPNGPCAAERRLGSGCSRLNTHKPPREGSNSDSALFKNNRPLTMDSLCSETQRRADTNHRQNASTSNGALVGSGGSTVDTFKPQLKNASASDGGPVGPAKSTWAPNKSPKIKSILTVGFFTKELNMGHRHTIRKMEPTLPVDPRGQGSQHVKQRNHPRHGPTPAGEFLEVEDST